MTNSNSFDNYCDFIKYLNNKKIKELNSSMKKLFTYLYDDLTEEDFITCWKDSYNPKTDIIININGILKRISIKNQYKNIIHTESISTFTNFLYRSGIPVKVINAYKKYHFADGTITGKGYKIISDDEYHKKYQEEIDEINKFLNTDKVLKLAINRFILCENNTHVKIDALIYGELSNFLWLTSEEIYKMLLSQKEVYNKAIHFSSLTVGPQERCLSYNNKYERDRYCVQIKWRSLFDDIIKNLSS